MNSCVIVSAGHGCVYAAIALRQKEFQGPVALLSDDANSTHQRLPLFKVYLTGKIDDNALNLRPDKFFVDQRATNECCKWQSVLSSEDHCVIRGDANWWFFGLSIPRGQLQAVESVNHQADGMIARKRIGNSAHLTREQAANSQFDRDAAL